jgi:hypothetical protein
MPGRLLQLVFRMCKFTFVLSKFEQLLLKKIKHGVIALSVIILYTYYFFFQMKLVVCAMNGTHLNLKLIIFSDV